MLRIGIDIGGTFTDFAIWKDEGEGYVQIGSRKAPTSRPDFAEAVTSGIAEIAEAAGGGRDDPMLVVHGTTVSTNAVIERSQPPVALITTAGFRDVLGIARLRLDKPVDLFNRRVVPLVPRERVFPVVERVLADGRVDRPLDEAGVIAATRRAVELGARAVAVCFLHSQVIGVERLLLAEMRYAAQSFTIPIDLSGAIAGGEAAVLEAFHAEHERLFGHAARGTPVAIDTLRVRTLGRQRKPSDAPLPLASDTSAAPVARRRLRFGRAWVEDVPIYDWADLPRGWDASGPAVVQQDLATILVPPGYSAQLGLRGDLELARS